MVKESSSLWKESQSQELMVSKDVLLEVDDFVVWHLMLFMASLMGESVNVSVLGHRFGDWG